MITVWVICSRRWERNSRRRFHHFPGFVGGFLNSANQLFLFAFGVTEVDLRELAPFLFQLVLGNITVPLDFECRHREDKNGSGT
jgi:hypothetical protein